MVDLKINDQIEAKLRPQQSAEQQIQTTFTQLTNRLQLFQNHYTAMITRKQLVCICIVGMHEGASLFPK